MFQKFGVNIFYIPLKRFTVEAFAQCKAICDAVITHDLEHEKCFWSTENVAYFPNDTVLAIGTAAK